MGRPNRAISAFYPALGTNVYIHVMNRLLKLRCNIVPMFLVPTLAAAAALCSAPFAPPVATGQEWQELFKGRADFGFVTGVHWIENKLFFFDSPAPAGSDGGEVYVWDFASQKAHKVFQVQEQGVTTMRQVGGALYIPGTDAMESWDLGNVYRSADRGETWKKLRSIPVGVHVWDVCGWRGKLYASTGSVRDGKGYGAVCVSTDQGQTWTESLMAYPPAPQTASQYARCYVLIPTEGALYASFVARDNQKVLDTPDREFYRFDGRSWTPIKLLPERIGTPYFGLRHREVRGVSFLLGRPNSFLLKSGKASVLKGLEKLTTFMVAAHGQHVYAVASTSDGKSSAVYRAVLEKVLTGDGTFEKAFDLPSDQEGISLEVAWDSLYVGTRAKYGGRLLVRRLSPRTRMDSPIITSSSLVHVRPPPKSLHHLRPRGLRAFDRAP